MGVANCSAKLGKKAWGRSKTSVGGTKIVYQKLRDELILTNGGFLVDHSGKIITVKSPSLLSRYYSLYKNDKVIGTIYSEKRGVSLPPIQYKAVFDKAEIENLYGLILFSMRLTTFD